MNDFWETLRFIMMAVPAMVVATIPWLIIAVPLGLALQQFEGDNGDNEIAMILSLGVAGICYLAVPPYAVFTRLCIAAGSWLATGEWEYTSVAKPTGIPYKKIIGTLLLTVTWATVIVFGYWLESFDWPNLLLAVVAVPLLWSGYIASFIILERYFSDRENNR